MELKGDLEVVNLQATAGYVFAADNRRTQRPFGAEVGVALAKDFGGADFVVQPGERPLWYVRQGAVKFSESRKIMFSSLAGGAHELTVTVNGNSEDARDVLREAWSRIGELAGEEECSLTDFQGTFANSTTAVVRLPIAATELIPPLDVMSTYVRARLGGSLLQPPGALPFRLSIPLSISIRGLAIERHLIIEPRFTSLTEDRVYFTVSPLPSDEHVEMLRQILSRAAHRDSATAG